MPEESSGDCSCWLCAFDRAEREDRARAEREDRARAEREKEKLFALRRERFLIYKCAVKLGIVFLMLPVLLLYRIVVLMGPVTDEPWFSDR